VSTDWSPLKGNPAPGDIALLDAYVHIAQVVAEETEAHQQQVTQLMSALGPEVWIGESAERFRAVLETATVHLGAVGLAHEGVQQALAVHSSTLAGLQGISAQLLSTATEDLSRIASASEQLTGAQAVLSRTESTLASLQSQLDAVSHSIVSETSNIAHLAVAVATDASQTVVAASRAAIDDLQGQHANLTALHADEQRTLVASQGLIAELERVIEEAKADLSRATQRADGVRAEFAEAVTSARRRIEDHLSSDIRRWRYEAGRDFAAIGSSVHYLDEQLVRVVDESAIDEAHWANDAIPYVHSVLQLSKDWGPIAAPLIGAIPAVGGVFSDVTTSDSEARMLQDLETHRYQQAGNELSGLGASAAYDVKGPEGWLVGTDITLVAAAENSARAINWSYTVHHLSQLDPFVPGAMSAVWQGEVHGLAPVFEDIVGGTISHIL
jgi:predicted  nucleic acid-binding Zn-ribbon protein